VLSDANTSVCACVCVLGHAFPHSSVCAHSTDSWDSGGKGSAIGCQKGPDVVVFS